VAVLGRSVPLRASYTRGSVAPGTKIQTLTDDFQDGVVGPQWAGYGTFFETGGFAVVSADTGFSGYASARTYSLIESELVVQVYSPVKGGATTAAFAEVNLQSDQQPAGTVLSVQFDAITNTIWAFNLVGFAEVGVAAGVAFTPGTGVWVRVRETAGQVLFYSSSTGAPSSWGAPFRTITTTPAWVTTSAIGVNLQAHRSDGTNDFASFDNVNLGPSDPLPPQPMWRPAPWRRPVPYPAWFSRGFIPPDPGAPQPIVVLPQSGRRPFPLPPGARMLRAPEVRPAPSNRVGVGPRRFDAGAAVGAAEVGHGRCGTGRGGPRRRLRIGRAGRVRVGDDQFGPAVVAGRAGDHHVRPRLHPGHPFG
jgi:hypothetical protein